VREPLEHLPLFVYGTLLFDEVLEPLLGRLPASRPAKLEDHEARRLPGVPWPGLIEHHGGIVEGRLLVDLEDHEVMVLDEYEDDYYELVAVVVSVGQTRLEATTYRVEPTLVEAARWTPGWFAEEHLDAFVADLLS
jgi:gamma-glutamylcyclotransferase (GGCT)/AIG2-like uncharacterized protein YtfP